MQRGLPARYFTDSSIYNEETARIFSRKWLCLDRASTVGPVGTYRTYQATGSSLVVMRGNDQPRAFHNVCRHRGALLCSESEGALVNNCLQCPYHAWTYDQTGRLRSAPNMRDEPQFNPAQFGLVEVGCVEWAGFLMVNLNQPSGSFEQAYAPVLHHFDPWGLADLRSEGRLEYEVQANWKLLFQNFSECYHCPTVHPILAQLTPYRSATNDLAAGGFQGGPMELADGVATMSTDGKAVAPPLSQVTGELEKQVGYYTLFPTMFISPHPDYVMVHRLQRQAVDCTRVVCEFLFDAHALAAGQVNAQPAIEFWDTTNRQDWHVCELVQRGAQSGALPPGPYGPLETVLPQFDAHYLRQMQIV